MARFPLVLFDCRLIVPFERPVNAGAGLPFLELGLIWR